MRVTRLLLCGATTLGFVVALALAAPAVRAEGGFFDFLFGQSPQPAAPQRAAIPRERPRPRPAAPARPQARRIAPIAASTPAVKPDFVVGVFGDDFATSIARGLSDTDNPGGTRQVADRSDDASGVTITDGSVWDKAIEAVRTQSGRLDAAVLLIGSNDAVALADAKGVKQAPGSPGWRALFGDKVARLADVFRDKHVPLVWVGLPIVRDAAQSQIYAAMNEVIADRAAREGASFVDSWQPFADENGEFSVTGPDVNGNPATLRWTNGWNFTRAGAKKLASFTLPDLKRLRDRARATEELAVVPAKNADAFDQALAIDVNAQILREAGLPVPSAAVPVRTQPGPVIALTAAPVASDGLLATIEAPLASPNPPAALHAGRADDFTWPRR